MLTRRIQAIVWLVVPLAWAVGCAGPPPPRTVYQDPITAVQLRADTKAAQAHTHPAALTPEQVKTVLGGIRVQPREEPIMSVLGSMPAVLPAFSPTELQALSLPISTALATAKPNELITFYRRISDTEIGLGFTTGGIFVEKGLIYIILANYRALPIDGMVRGVPGYLVDPVNDPLLTLGKKSYKLSYVRPEAEVHPVEWSGRYDPLHTLIVDIILAMGGMPGSSRPSQP